MAIKPDLFRAILAMDAYNRGYNAGINIGDPSNPNDPAKIQIGTATLGRATNEQTEPAAVAASFFAQAYSWNGKTVISYRGTDSPAADSPAFTMGGGPVFYRPRKKGHTNCRPALHSCTNTSLMRAA